MDRLADSCRRAAAPHRPTGSSDGHSFAVRSDGRRSRCWNVQGALLFASIIVQSFVLLMAGARIEASAVGAALFCGYIGRALKLRPLWWRATIIFLGIGLLTSWLSRRHAGVDEVTYLTWMLPAAAWLLSAQTLELFKPIHGPGFPWNVTRLGVPTIFLLLTSPATPIFSSSGMTWAAVGAGTWALSQAASPHRPHGDHPFLWQRCTILIVLLSVALMAGRQINAAIESQLPRFQTAVTAQLGQRISGL